ncbi:hypothetical protein MKW94_005231 [Papaver nudicaule]|uniref:Fiber protein Fb34 n=1 Tax=Papaver nudicaule TaxID=74823 RepID=A0AA42AY85_PAPNU|nr:hypothetical protein [Papaver nudicaule]
MAISISILVIITCLHLIAFVFAIGAEQRRSTGKLVPDEYDETKFCVYTTDASTVYGLTAFGLLLLSQGIVNGVTKCLCFGRGLTNGTSSKTFSVIFFVISWLGFLGAEACLLAGSAKNAYHTKYIADYNLPNFSCATLRKGVFAAAAALTLISMVGSILYYWSHTKADTGGWQKHTNEGLGMTSQEDHKQDQRV